MMSTERTYITGDEPTLSPEQIAFIEKLKLPEHVSIQTDSQFDSTTSDTAKDKWRFVLGGEKVMINFSIIPDLSMRKLAKFCISSFISFGRPFRESDWFKLRDAFNFKNFSYIGFVEKLNSNELLDDPRKYFSIKGLLRLLCQLNCPGFPVEKLESFILIPTPNSANAFLKYQDLENAFPSPLKGMIARSIVSASNKRTTLSDNEVIDFTLFGLSYYTGMRPIQFSKLTAGDFKLDSSHDSSSLYRYSLNMPYAKQTTITNSRIRIALPSELGLLVDEYIKRAKLNCDDRFVLVDEYLIQYLNDTLQRVLYSIQPHETKLQISKGDIILPRLTTYDFRHNVGHSLALAGASADEIAYMLGHSSLIAATYYISATPELAMLKSKVLGDNPVWQNMVNLMLTGYVIEEAEWSSRTVSGTVGGQLHIRIGGCQRPDDTCHLAKVRSCYGCFYFRPFTNMNKHLAVLSCVNKELLDTLEVSEKSGNVKNPALEILASMKGEVQMVINRIKGELKL